MYGTLTYKSWNSMLSRCSCSSSKWWPYYGGRGITVCDRWRDFENFLADMGPRPSRKWSIDRIDNDGGYEPSNCRWATQLTQQNNRGNNIRIETQGEILTAAQYARTIGVKPNTFHKRLRELRHAAS